MIFIPLVQGGRMSGGHQETEAVLLCSRQMLVLRIPVGVPAGHAVATGRASTASARTCWFSPSPPPLSSPLFLPPPLAEGVV